MLNRLGRIVVLKDGGIVEQGSHRELLGQDGLFASMWAQQVSASEEPLTSKPGVGYDMDEAPVVDVPESVTMSSAVDDRVVAESPQVVPASLQVKEGEADVGVAFPVSDDAAGVVSDSGPLAFPTTSTSNAPSVRSHPTGHAHGVSVTFDAGALNTPPRTGTPEPGSGSGRKTVQNIQRLARRISLSGKGPKLGNLPGLRRDSSMMSTASASASGAVSTPPSTSARESVEEQQEDVEMSKEERKKRKKRKSFM